MNFKFELGRVVATAGVHEKMEEDPRFKKFVRICLGRYIASDWGDTCKEDCKYNDDAVDCGERILAVYNYYDTDIKIWIITEWDRSVTTILFPSEY